MRVRTAAVALGAAALVLGSALPAMADSESDAAGSTAARETATVVVPVHTVSGMRALTGKAGAVDIQLGNSGPIRVGVDTGYTGLIIFPSARQKLRNAVISKTATTVRLSNGRTIKGFKGSATMTISGVKTVNPITFIYTTSTSAFFRAQRSTGVGGLMGIGLKGDSLMTNPLSGLPGELGVRWSLHLSRSRAAHGRDAGQLVLGALPPTSPTMVFTMPDAGNDANGAKLWNDHDITACWTFGRLPEMCLPTTFDSEFTVLRATGVSGRGLQVDADGDFRYATRVKLAAPTSAFVGWSYLSGQRASDNRTQAFKHGKAAVNTGNAVFFDFTINYNSVTGKLYLSNPTRKAA